MIEKINKPEDIKKLSIEELNILAKEIRDLIINVTSKNGGHVAPSLGAVEITIALLYVFEPPYDKIIWDVGHQAYAWKILTGRKDVFHKLRQYNGISGFLKMEESIYDAYGAGHASTSISAALGFASGRDLNKENYNVVAIIGDGAMSGGISFEGINNLGHMKKNMLIILNDNKMSISKNVGGLSNYLLKLQSAKIYNKLKDDVWNLLGELPMSEKTRESAKKLAEGLKNLFVPNILFDELGIRYFGPVDGHNIKDLIITLEKLKFISGPKILHVLTQKGKGYTYAETMPTKFHGLGVFDPETGETVKSSNPTYSEIFGRALTEFAKKDKDIVAITAAMPEGTGLDIFRETFRERFFDVGIAEEHAVIFSCGLSLTGKKPVCAIYSTFLQRAFDPIIHDAALQKIPVIFAIDRGGVVGEDGPTHHGVFDISYLRIIPNIVLMVPKDGKELIDMLYTAINYKGGPIAFRYPRDKVDSEIKFDEAKIIPIGEWEIIREGKDILILSTGTLIKNLLEAVDRIKDINPTIINARFVKPLDEKMLKKYIPSSKFIVTLEENSLMGGFGSAILEYLNNEGIKKNVLRLGFPDKFIEQGKREKLLSIYGLDADGIEKSLRKFLNEKKDNKE
uniref:1-deoxy-D-xylulose-5-phosphate synthase n=1 Tax=candidate division WOR-3 bacterium TaxID=2052148 RepID=A0A7C4U8Z1_UNCW3